MAAASLTPGSAVGCFLAIVAAGSLGCRHPDRFTLDRTPDAGAAVRSPEPDPAGMVLIPGGVLHHQSSADAHRAGDRRRAEPPGRLLPVQHRLLHALSGGGAEPRHPEHRAQQRRVSLRPRR
jgi:hypothetical protein